MRSVRWSLCAAAVAVVALSGCTQVPPEIREAEALACPSGSDCYDEPRPDGPGGQMTVDGGEWFFEVTQGAAVEGPVEITFENVGTTEHNLTIDEAYGDVKAVPPGDATIPGGASETGTLELFAGQTVIYCSVPGHRAQGMELVITVAAPGEEVQPVGEEGAATPGEGGAEPVEPSPEGDEPAPQDPPNVPQQTEPAGGG